MDNETNEQESMKGVSRRAALKAGVGAGVGLAAWTGPTITSLGGTPAYAQGGSPVIIELGGGCANVPQDHDPHSYQLNSLQSVPLYDITPSGKQPCGTQFTFSHPSNQTCTITIGISSGNSECNAGNYDIASATFSTVALGDTSIVFTAPCYPGDRPDGAGPGSKYTVFAVCV